MISADTPDDAAFSIRHYRCRCRYASFADSYADVIFFASVAIISPLTLPPITFSRHAFRHAADAFADVSRFR